MNRYLNKTFSVNKPVLGYAPDMILPSLTVMKYKLPTYKWNLVCLTNLPRLLSFQYFVSWCQQVCVKMCVYYTWLCVTSGDSFLSVFSLVLLLLFSCQCRGVSPCTNPPSLPTHLRDRDVYSFSSPASNNAYVSYLNNLGEIKLLSCILIKCDSAYTGL